MFFFGTFQLQETSRDFEYNWSPGIPRRRVLYLGDGILGLRATESTGARGKISLRKEPELAEPNFKSNKARN